MKVSVSRLFSLLLAFALLLLPLTPSAAAHQEPSETSSAGNGVLFVENAGQWDAGARYQAWGGSAGTLWLAKDALWLTLVEQPAGEGADDEANLSRHFNAPRVGAASEAVTGTVANVRLSFPGANPHPRLEPYARLDTIVSYFLGSDPAGWHAAVPVWAGVRYVDLYPGIDLEVGGDGGQVTPRLVARPGADLGPVSLRVEGAEAVSVEGGRLQVSTAAGDLAFPLLAVDGAAIGQAPHVAAAGGVFDVAAPLTAGRTGASAGTLTGRTAAGRGVQAATGVTTTLLYSTFLGGNYYEDDVDLAVDAAGRAYVTGDTESADFPTTPGAFDTSPNDGYLDSDIFVARLNAAGSALEYATFLGGSGIDYGDSIALDGTGRAYVTGSTYSSDFPTTAGAYDTTYNGSSTLNVIVARLNADGSVLEYATFVGAGALGRGIAVDTAGRAYVVGRTWSSLFPTTTGVLDTGYGGVTDAFVLRLNAAGSALEYATYLGGTDYDEARGIALDAAGRAYVTGFTYSPDFPTTPAAFDYSLNGNDDTFVVCLNESGSALVYATFLGEILADGGQAIALDASGRAYVAGATRSPYFPTTPGAFDTSYNGGQLDGFVARLDATGSVLEYATFLGGSDYDTVDWDRGGCGRARVRDGLHQVERLPHDFWRS